MVSQLFVIGNVAPPTMKLDILLYLVFLMLDSFRSVSPIWKMCDMIVTVIALSNAYVVKLCQVFWKQSDVFYHSVGAF